MDNKSKRQEIILSIINEKSSASNKEILEIIHAKKIQISRPTLSRDLAELVVEKQLEIIGSGRAVQYQLIQKNPFLRQINIQKYFAFENIQQRNQFFSFNKKMITDTKNIFTSLERDELKKLNQEYLLQAESKSLQEIKYYMSLFANQYAQNFLQQYENFYGITQNQRMQLRDAIIASIEHVRNYPHQFQNIQQESFYDLYEIFISIAPQFHQEDHQQGEENYQQRLSLTFSQLSTDHYVRSQTSAVLGSWYQPPQTRDQISSALQLLVQHINHSTEPFERAFLCFVLLPAIRPFVQYNSLFSLLFSSAILITSNALPLLWYSFDYLYYLQSQIVFFEQHSFYELKKFFLQEVQESHHFFCKCE